MIKLKDIIKESKVSYLTESFKSNILRRVTKKQNWQLDRDLFTWLAKLGVQASEIQDKHITKSLKPTKKGIEIVVTGKKVVLPAKGRDYWRSDAELGKDVVINVLRDGKPVWYTKSWGSKRNTRINVKQKGSYGSDDLQTFGLAKTGYQSLNSIKSIPGLIYFQISLDENLPYMGAKVLRQLRHDVQLGSWRFSRASDFKQENERRYSNALSRLYDDPAKVKGLVTKAKNYTNKVMMGLIGGQPNAQSNAVIKGRKAFDPKDEGDVMRLLMDITTAMNKLYDKLEYYSNDLENDMHNKKENPQWTGKYDRAPEQGKEIGSIVAQIMKHQFGRIW